MVPEDLEQTSHTVSDRDQVGTLVFHIGDHKTGSTSIQDTFAAGRVRLEGRHLIYPAMLNHNHLVEQFRVLYRGKPLPKRDKTAAKTAKSNFKLPALARRIGKSGADYALISGEVFENLEPKIFHDIIQTYFRSRAERIRIVAYVRPHAARLVSSYIEQVKIGWYQGDLESYFAHTLRNRRFFYAPRFKAWRTLFGQDFILRPMIRDHLHRGSVVEDFVQVAFDNSPYKIVEGPNANESLGLEDLMALKYMHSHFQETGQWLRHTVGWELARLLSQDKSSRSTKLRLHRALAEKVQAAYAADAVEMDASFFAGECLLQQSLAESVETSVENAFSCNPDDYLEAAERHRLKACCRLVADLLGQQSDWPKTARRRRLKALKTSAF